MKIIRKDAVEFSGKIPNWKEIEILQQLDHPNIVKMMDTYQTEEKMYIFMEYIQGRNLKEVILTNKQPIAKVRSLFRQIVEAVLYCHRMNIFHRDIKPR